jgi:WXG100 family type VII secretion target
MADRIAVPPELGNASGNIHGRASEFAATLASLRSRVAALADTWKGDAHTNYTYYTNEWDAAAAALFGTGETGLLPSIGDAMQTVWNNYVETESTNTQGWKHS